MSDIALIKPNIKYAKQIIDYKNETPKERNYLAGCSNLAECETAQQWLSTLELYENEDTCPKNLVPSTTYLAVRKSDDVLVGVIQIRHHINHPVLAKWGGHIGYSVRPNERRKGYATQMLKEVLLICKNRGIEKVLITCNENNIASEKTILSNGGVFDGLVQATPELGNMKRHFIYL